MSDHDGKHHAGEHGGPGFHGDGEHPKDRGRKWHKDWRVWTVVVLMLAALAAYVLTLDDFTTLLGRPAAKAAPADAGAR